MSNWYPSDYYIQPRYETYPNLVLVDLASPRLRPRRRTFWEKARDRAIAGWATCGTHFEVIESSSGYRCVRVPNDEECAALRAYWEV